MRIIFIGIFLLLGAEQVGAQALAGLEATGVKIVGFPKEGRMEADGTGPYANLVRAVLAEAGFSDQLSTVPVMRSLRLFETQPEICLVPVSKLAVQHQYPNIDPNSLIESVPIDYISGHLVTRPGTKPITDMAEIQNKNVGAWSGVNVSVFFPNYTFTLLQTESEKNAIKMLMGKRVDIIWGWVPDVLILFEEMQLGTPVLALDRPIFGSSAHFVCKKSERSATLMPRLDKVISLMRADGRLKKTLGKYARIVGVDVPMSVWQK